MIRKNINKAKFSAPPPERIDPERIYSFSFNPQSQPLFERFYNVKLNTLSSWSDEQEQIFKSLKHASVEICQEISSRGRLHYHGYIKIHNVIPFYLTSLKHIAHYGTYEIDEINDNEKWAKYVSKQESLMKPYCERNDMHYSISTI